METHITGGQYRRLQTYSLTPRARSAAHHVQSRGVGRPAKIRVTIVGPTSADSMPYNNTVARIEAWVTRHRAVATAPGNRSRQAAATKAEWIQWMQGAAGTAPLQLWTT